MIEYRSFLNSDPPQIVALWQSCQLGRGAATGVSADAFETVTFAQPYFDPAGLIVACDENRVVGMAHAGFAGSDSQRSLDRSLGAIHLVLVHPQYRRRGIGRELVRRAEAYLEQSGSKTITAGAAAPLDSFYYGLYGGSEPCGFLESDTNAAPFMQAIGWEPVERHLVYQCDLNTHTAPVSFRLVTIRRQMELGIAQQPEPLTWWWVTRFGRLDTLQFLLVPKGGGPPVASATVLGLDLYMQSWKQRAVGLTEIFVPEHERRKGYGQALLLAIGRRLKDELVTCLEVHAPESNPAAVGLCESCGLTRVDAGVVYQRAGAGPSRVVLEESTIVEAPPKPSHSPGESQDPNSADTTIEFRVE